MPKLIHDSPHLELWKNLITEAELSCDIALEEELESYLVFLLIRFINSPALTHSLIALDWLKAHSKGAKYQRYDALQTVGDKCLLFAGLFPGIARKRRVPIAYYVELGQQAYHAMGNQLGKDTQTLFYDLAEHFVSLMDILHATRETSGLENSLDLLQAEELWKDTGSLHAKSVLEGKILDISRLISEASPRKH